MKYIPHDLDLERLEVLMSTLSGKGPEACEIVDSAYHVSGFMLHNLIDCPHDDHVHKLTGPDGQTPVKDYGSVSNDDKIKALETLKQFDAAETKAAKSTKRKVSEMPGSEAKKKAAEKADETEQQPEKVGYDFVIPWGLIRMILQELIDRYLPVT